MLLRAFFRLTQIVAIAAMTLPASADFKVCHQADQVVDLAYSYFDKQNRGWVVAGWFSIAPRSCRSLSVGDVRGSKFYIYGEVAGDSYRWSGSTSICIERPNAFRITNTKRACGETAKFIEVNTGGYSDYTYTMTVTPSEKRAIASRIGGSSQQSDRSSSDDKPDDAPSGSSQSDSEASKSEVRASDDQIRQAVSDMAVVIQHPVNGKLYFYPDRSGWYLMRLNTAQGQPLGEGGRWSARDGQLCIDTALKKPEFTGCGDFKLLGGNRVSWDHDYTTGLDAWIITRDQARRE